MYMMFVLLLRMNEEIGRQAPYEVQQGETESPASGED